MVEYVVHEQWIWVQVHASYEKSIKCDDGIWNTNLFYLIEWLLFHKFGTILYCCNWIINSLVFRYRYYCKCWLWVFGDLLDLEVL